eukprot:Sspe_Gene.37153::Locus_17916_Transcript_1_1_Confidence_1.000_Length_425::g.37153::m.37153
MNIMPVTARQRKMLEAGVPIVTPGIVDPAKPRRGRPPRPPTPYKPAVPVETSSGEELEEHQPTRERRRRREVKKRPLEQQEGRVEESEDEEVPAKRPRRGWDRSADGESAAQPSREVQVPSKAVLLLEQ